MYLAGTGVWMDGVPFSGADPSGGPIGSMLDWMGGRVPKAFFQNLQPITQNSRWVGFHYVKVKQLTNGVPTYIDAMSGTVPTPFDPDIENGRSTRPVTPNGFITTRRICKV